MHLSIPLATPSLTRSESDESPRGIFNHPSDGRHLIGYNLQHSMQTDEKIGVPGMILNGLSSVPSRAAPP
jgi:hypothetical protein